MSNVTKVGINKGFTTNPIITTALIGEVENDTLINQLSWKLREKNNVLSGSVVIDGARLLSQRSATKIMPINKRAIKVKMRFNFNTGRMSVLILYQIYRESFTTFDDKEIRVVETSLRNDLEIKIDMNSEYHVVFGNLMNTSINNHAVSYKTADNDEKYIIDVKDLISLFQCIVLHKLQEKGKFTCYQSENFNNIISNLL